MTCQCFRQRRSFKLEGAGALEVVVVVVEVVLAVPSVTPSGITLHSGQVQVVVENGAAWWNYCTHTHTLFFVLFFFFLYFSVCMCVPICVTLRQQQQPKRALAQKHCLPACQPASSSLIKIAHTATVRCQKGTIVWREIGI